MENPNPDPEASADSSANPMAGLAASWRETRDTRTQLERLIEVVTTLEEPTRVSTIADTAGCSPTFAGEKLDLLADLGVVERTADQPAEYRRDEVHFRRLRARQIAAEYEGDIDAALEAYLERDERLQERFGVTAPGAVASEYFDQFEDPDRLTEATEALATWSVVRQRLHDLQRAAAIDAASKPSPTPAPSTVLSDPETVTEIDS
jgi:predicted ArsR family transcriptional regulator